MGEGIVEFLYTLTKKERLAILINTMTKQFRRIFILLISIFSVAGCSGVSTPESQTSAPRAVYAISYKADTHELSIKSINVTPSLAGQNISPFAGVFQVGNAVFNGTSVTAPVYITNNDSSGWTGVEMQAYTLASGSATVCDADLGTGWLTDSPVDGAWGWLFTSGTAGSQFTIPSNTQSVAREIGFDATSDFAGIVYIYADVPVITGIDPVIALTGSTITLTGYNFSTTQGAVTVNGVAATVLTWTASVITATVPATATLGNVVVDSGDSHVPYSNPMLFTPFSILANDQTFATINAPIGITTDTSGNLYIANFSNNNILEVTPSGAISTYSNDPSALINGPADVAFSPEGTLYEANSGGNNVIAVPGGAAPAFVFAGVGTAPVALAFSGDGQSWPLYVVNSGDGTISSVASNGTVTPFASGFGLPNAVATDNAGNVYVGDCSSGNGSVDEINAAGTVTTTVVSGLICPGGIKFDAGGNMYIFDSGSAAIYKYNPNIACGSKLTTFIQDISTNGDGEFVFSPDRSLLYMTQDSPVNGIITIPLK